jgi:hypothetical protein
MTVGLLEGFQQRDEEAGQRHARAVKRVAEDVFSLAVFIAQVNSPGLEILAIAS